MAEHHSGTVHLTGQAQPDQPDPEDTAIELTPEDVATIANIMIAAGRELAAYSKAQGWGHHRTIDVLRDGPPVANYYDAAYHGAPDLTAEEAAAHLAEHQEEEATPDMEGLSAEEMLVELRRLDPDLAEVLERVMAKQES